MDDDDLLDEAALRRRAEAKRQVALRMVTDREHCREAWVAAGFAVEFALKALIMRRNGWTAWPDKASRPDLHVHALHVLFVAAEIDVKTVPPVLRASVRQVLDWERRHDYHGAKMPRKVARSMVDAAFGEDGVIAWLDQM